MVLRGAPLVPVAVAWITGIAIAGIIAADSILRRPSTVVPACLLSLCFALLLLLRYRPLIATAMAWMLCFMAGFLALQVRQMVLCDPALRVVQSGQRIVIAGRVDGIPQQRNEHLRFLCRLIAVRADTGWRAARGRLLVHAPAVLNLESGGLVVAVGHFVRPVAVRNPGGFREARFLAALHAQGRFVIRGDESLAVLPAEIAFFDKGRRLLARVQATIDRTIDRLFDDQTAPIVRGLILGDRSSIDEDTIEAFSRSGIVHILAVSGLHIGIILVLGTAIGSLLHLRGTALVLFILLLTWFYAILTGLKPPVFRSAVMASFYLLGRLRDRPTPPANLLALAALVIVVVRPYEVFAIGFQLSFAAIGGILFLTPRIERCVNRPALMQRMLSIRPLRVTLLAFVVTLAAQAGTLPFGAYHFGRISLIAVAINPPVVFMVFLLVSAAVTALLLVPLSPWLADLAAQACALLNATILRLSTQSAGLSFASIDHWYPPIWAVCLYFGMMSLILVWNRRRLRFIVLCGMLALANGWVWQQALLPAHRLQVTYLHIGQGDASLLQLPGNHTLLIDAGPISPGYDAGKREILPFLRRENVRQLDLVIITHPHADHYGGLAALSSAIRIGCVAVADTGYRSPGFQQLLARLKTAGIPIEILRRGQVIDRFAPVKLWVLGPSQKNARRQHDLNEASLVIQVRYGEHSFLFTGDAEMLGEAALLPYGPLLQSVALQVGHHGSRTSSSEALLKQVRPAYAIISAGVFNRFGHPAPEVTRRLASFGADTLRLDRLGGVQIRSDGERLRVFVARQEETCFSAHKPLLFQR